MKNTTKIERLRERELVVTRIIHGPPRLVYRAFTEPELFQRWWVPKSCGATMLSCELDVRTGGKYRLVFGMGDLPPMAFFGRYVEVTPPSRMVWTNDEGEAPGPITTVTFEAHGEDTRVVMHELYPSKEALEAAMSSGEKDGMEEVFTQLEELLASVG